MKKTIIFGLFLLPFWYSCQKAINTAPLNTFSSTNAFATAAKIDLSLNGGYDAAQSGLYTDGTKRGYPFGAANFEMGDMMGEDLINVATFYQIVYQATYNSVSPNIIAMWKGCYDLVNE